MSELVWQLERDLWYANEKIRILELKVAKLEIAVANGGKVSASNGSSEQTQFNALYDVHGC